MIDLSTPLVMLTVGQLLEILKGNEQPKVIDTTDKAYQYGLQAIADYLHISKPTVSVWRNNGKLNSIKWHSSGRLVWVSEEDLDNFLLNNTK